jgi:hypothetical protein
MILASDKYCVRAVYGISWLMRIDCVRPAIYTESYTIIVWAVQIC